MMDDKHQPVRPGPAVATGIVSETAPRGLQAVLDQARRDLEETVDQLAAQARLTGAELERYRCARDLAGTLVALGGADSLRVAVRIFRSVRYDLQRAADDRQQPVGAGPGRPDRLSKLPLARTPRFIARSGSVPQPS